MFTERTSVGLDVHALSVRAAGLDTVTGQLVHETLTPSTDHVRDWLRRLPQPVAIYEAGPAQTVRTNPPLEGCDGVVVVTSSGNITGPSDAVPAPVVSVHVPHGRLRVLTRVAHPPGRATGPRPTTPCDARLHVTQNSW